MTKSQFRMVIGASLVLGFVSIALILRFNPPLPAELDRWATEQSYDEFGPFEWLAIALLLPYLVGSIGMLFFARWSRVLFAGGILGVTLATLFSGASVTTALESFLNELSLLMDGFILALAYFSDARHHFGQHPRTSVAQAA